jgi:hypothetical protein
MRSIHPLVDLRNTSTDRSTDRIYRIDPLVDLGDTSTDRSTDRIYRIDPLVDLGDTSIDRQDFIESILWPICGHLDRWIDGILSDQFVAQSRDTSIDRLIGFYQIDPLVDLGSPRSIYRSIDGILSDQSLG